MVQKKYLTIGVMLIALVIVGVAGYLILQPTAPKLPTEHEGKVSFYTSIPLVNARTIVEAFNKRYPNIVVALNVVAGETLAEKMELEIKTGVLQADVVASNVPDSIRSFKDRGLLVKFVPLEVAGIPDQYKDPDGYWYQLTNTHMVFMYNTKALTKAEAPKSWAELADPKWLGKLAFISPITAGTGMRIVSQLTQVYGWEYWQKVAKNKPRIYDGNAAILASIITGERIVSPGVDYLVFPAIARGEPIAYIIPEDGMPASVVWAAIMKGGPNPKAAQILLNWLVSKEGDAAQAAAGNYPVRTGAEPPKGFPSMATAKLMTFDYSKDREIRERIKDEWDKLFAA